MRYTLALAILIAPLLLAAPAAAQTGDDGSDALGIDLLDWYSPILDSPEATADDQPDGTGQYLGRLSSNPYDSDSVSNPYGTYGSPYSSNSINNPYGTYGSPYSSKSTTNPYATDAPKIYSSDGTYLGRLSSNPYDSDSVSNPYGRYGSEYSSESINNPYSVYGSPYSSQSPNNPYTLNAPSIFDDDE